MSKTIDEIRRDLAKKPLERSMRIERDAVDEENRTVTLAFASDKPVEHWFGTLSLSMKPGAMRTDRLASGAPLLMDHNPTDQVGVVEEYSVDEKGGMARAVVRFDTDQRSTDIFNSVKNNIRRNVSVGFMVNSLELVEEKKGEMPTYRCDDWEPMEISIVSMPADISVGVGRSKDFEGDDPTKQISNDSPIERGNSIQETTMAKENIETPESPVDVVRSKAELAADEVNRWGEQLGEQTLARTYLKECVIAKTDPSKEGFFERIKAETPETPKPQPLAATEHAKREGGVQLARSIPRFGRLNAFKGEGAAERAYRFGQFLMASVLGNQKSREFCSQNGIPVTRAMGESVNETGGYLVPDEFGNDLIDLREQYGVFRRNAKIVPMASDTRTDPRRTGGLTAYFVAEAGAITASDMAWDQVSLVAKKLAVLARYSSEITEDSSIAFGDTLAGEIAYAFAEKEDRCGFLGDASSTYGGITGVCDKLLNLSATRANIAGLVVGTGNLFSELVLGDFEAVVAKLPQYADTDAAAWYVHRGFYWNVMVKAMLASGGVTAAEIEDARKQRFMGYRVEFTQVMPNTDANDQIVALFGDLAKAASMGTRRDTQIALSEHSRFANDQIEIRGTERFDINVHDVGNQSATAASRVPGPIVGLVSAAS
jgi:HK97 family phage major capsid protein